MRDVIDDIKEAFLTGVSYMLPFVVAGGILVALGFLLGGYNIPSVEPYGSTFASTIFWIGKIGLGTFMVPVLGAYVAYSIADKPGICVGMFGGWMATDPWGLGYQSGFIGALIAGIIAGYLVNAIRSLLPTLIIPVVGCAAICLLMHYVIGGPLGALTQALTKLLNNLGTGNLILLGIVQGCMLALDMGGPCNKVAYAFALACMETGNYAPMAANFVACCAPPLAVALAMLIAPKKFTDEDRSGIPGCFAGALCMITEFAIPYAAKNIKYIPCFMVGSAAGAAISYLWGITIRAPHGGVFVVFAMTDKSKGTRGISAFIVEKGTPGFTFGTKENKMGICGSSTYELIFTDCRIPKDALLGQKGKGFNIAMHTLDGGRIGIAAQALGIAEGALETTVNYVKERKQFGRSIAQFQNTQFVLADLATKIEAAKLLVYKAARKKDEYQSGAKVSYSVEAAMAKLYAAEVAMEVTTKCVQLHGGYGYIKEYDVERMMRDAKITEIYEGTSEVQRMVISANLLK